MRFRQPRQRDEGHLRYLRELPCIVCKTNLTIDAAHIRFGDLRICKRPTGIGEKPSDQWALPLCRSCHTKQHSGKEELYWQQVGIDPVLYALALYAASGDYERGCQIVRNVSFRAWVAAQNNILAAG